MTSMLAGHLESDPLLEAQAKQSRIPIEERQESGDGEHSLLMGHNA